MYSKREKEHIDAVNFILQFLFIQQPLLIGVVVGYITSCFMRHVDFSTVSKASFFVLPNIKAAHFNVNTILTFL